MQIRDTERSFGCECLRVIAIENEALRIEIIPELGAKIYSVFYKAAGQEVLWHNPVIPPHRVSAADAYDDHWSGGWDDLFPNDEAAFPETWGFPDHGELWSASWQPKIVESGEMVAVHLDLECPSSRVHVEKKITIKTFGASIAVDYKFTNLNEAAVPYLFKLHPALAVRPNDKLRIPAGKFILEPRFLGTLREGPIVNEGFLLRQKERIVDLQVVPPPDTKELFFVYATDLLNGTVVLESQARGIQVTLRYPTDFFQSCWLFASYGGWNDYYVAVPEPCNGYPFRLEEALAEGRAEWLAPGGHKEIGVELLIGNLS